MFKKQNFLIFLNLFAVLSIIFGVSAIHIEKAFAAALSSLSDTQSSVKINVLSDHTIQFVTPTGVSATQSIVFTFPAGYNMGLTNINNVDFATSTSGTCTGFADGTLAASPSGGTWGFSTSSQTITITSGTGVIPANRCIQLRVGSNATFGATGVSQITNPATPGSYTITIGGGTFADSGSITENIITDDTVSVSATVQQSITFALSTSTIYFGTLSSGAAKFASSTNAGGDILENIAHTLAVSTNAPSGYNISLRGQTLTSQQYATNTINVIGLTPATSAPGSEQFGIRATASGGTGGTVDPTFSGASSYGFGATATTSEAFASGAVSTNTTTYSLRYIANIGGTTEAGTYVANLVYVATANF